MMRGQTGWPRRCMLAVGPLGRSASIVSWPFFPIWAIGCEGRDRTVVANRELGDRGVACSAGPWSQTRIRATDFAKPGRSRALGRRISANFRDHGQLCLLGRPLGKPDLRKCRPCAPKRRKRFFSRSDTFGVSPAQSAFPSFSAGMRFRKTSPKWGRLANED